jgi:hypothetical protein
LTVGNAAAKGAQVGAKAVVNASADTVVSTVTLGAVDNVELINVTNEDRSAGYDKAYVAGRIGTESLAAAGTMGLAELKAAGAAAKVVNAANKTLTALDTAQGVVNVAKGTKDIAENGVNLQNATQLATGALSLTPAISKLGKGNKVDDVAGSMKVKEVKSPNIKSKDLKGKTAKQIREMAKKKKLNPVGDKKSPDYPRKWKDPVTGKERLRIDKGHVDKRTGKPYDNPNAATDHVHGYDKEGKKIVDPKTKDPHFPLKENQ